MLSRFREALEDSQQAVRLDDCFMKVSEQYSYFQLFMPLFVLRPQLHLQNKEKFVKYLHSPKKEECHSCPTGSSAWGQVPPLIGKCDGGQSLLSEGFGAGAQQQGGPAGGEDHLSPSHFDFVYHHVGMLKNELGNSDLSVIIVKSVLKVIVMGFCFFFRIRLQRLYWSSNEWRILALKSGISERYFSSTLGFITLTNSQAPYCFFVT